MSSPPPSTAHVLFPKLGQYRSSGTVEDGKLTRAFVHCEVLFCLRCGVEKRGSQLENSDWSTEYAYTADSRYHRFSEEAFRLSARNLSGRRVRAHRRLDDRSAADP